MIVSEDMYLLYWFIIAMSAVFIAQYSGDSFLWGVSVGVWVGFNSLLMILLAMADPGTKELWRVFFRYCYWGVGSLGFTQ